MCGIAGWIVPARCSDDQAQLVRMSAAIAHRGPDDEGYFVSDALAGSYRVALAHKRLSILDLEGGRQPMQDAGARLTVVFNGEIYNFDTLRKELAAIGHRFATRSDTEVILAAYRQWGEQCVERFRGMFAFALWDADRERLVLARDRFGKKPLFVYRRGDALWFASEIKALLQCSAISAELDAGVIGDYLAFRYVPGPYTLFRGVRKMQPGSVGVWSNRQFETHRYYSPPDREPGSHADVDADVDERFLERLDEAVRIRMVCDVPFGAFLSGGIDSSTTVALMSRHSAHAIKTFSVGFGEERYSELSYARTVAKQFGTDHHELVIEPRDIVERLAQVVRFRDAPVSEPSDIPIFLLALDARRSVKMVLTGEGADEILGGYPKHVFERWSSAYQRVPQRIRASMLEPLVRALPYGLHRVKTAVAALGLEQPEHRLPRWFGALAPEQIAALCGRYEPRLQPPAAPFDSARDNSPLRRILYFDQVSWLPDNLLERGDSMTMAASLEARMPFMDHELAALASSLPDRYRVRGATTKWILRRAARRLLPAEILNRPKVGFRVPVNEWFRGPMRDYLRDHLLDGRALARQLFARAPLEALVAEHLDGEQNHEKLLWSLLNLEVWNRQCLVPAKDAPR